MHVELASGETLRFRFTFDKGTLLITDRRVIARVPIKLFEVFPAGHVEQSLGLGAVSSVVAGRRVRADRLFWGAGLGLFGLYSLFSGGVLVVVGLIALALALASFWSCMAMGLFVRNHGGGVLSVPASRGEWEELSRANHALCQALYGGSQSAAARRDQPAPAPQRAAEAGPAPTRVRVCGNPRCASYQLPMHGGRCPECGKPAVLGSVARA